MSKGASNQGSGRVVAVTGASGFVGRNVCRELLAQGYTVRGLVRNRKKAVEALPASDRLTLTTGDALDARALDDLLAGCHACINLVGIIREVREPGNTQTFQKLHTDTARALVQACDRAGVRRFVQMSALGVSDVHVSEYQRTKFEAESVIRKSGLDWTIFRPSLIHGVGGEFIEMARNWATGLEPPYLFLPYFTRSQEDKRVPLGGVEQIIPNIAPVAVEDVAAAFVKAISTPATVGEVYNLVGSETIAWPELLTHIRDNVSHANSGLSPFGIPGDIAAVAAMGADLVGLGSLLPFDEGMARMGAQDSTATLDKLKADLAISPRPFRQSFLAYASSI